MIVIDTLAMLDSLISPREVREKLARLVSIESVAEQQKLEARVVDEIVSWCQEDGFDYIVSDVAPGRPNLEIEWRGNRPGPVLLFEAHSDTVTQGRESSWDHPPFRLTVEGDRLYGRGTADTKGNLVACYLGLRALMTAVKDDFPGTIRFLVPVDEEGMMSGIRHYIASGRTQDVDAAVCCEPEDLRVCIRQKGALRLWIEIYGKMAHSAMPLAGNNALFAMAEFLRAVADEEQAIQTDVGFDPYLGWPSVTPTEVRAPIDGPSGFNVVPGSCAVSLDIRTVTGQDHDEIRERLQTRLDGVIEKANAFLNNYVADLRARLQEPMEKGQYSASLRVVDDRPVTDTPPDHPLVQAVAEAVLRRLGGPRILAGVPGSTDGTFLWEAGIPIVTIGAGNRLVAHQADEWVSLKQLSDAAIIYADAAYHFLTQSAASDG